MSKRSKLSRFLLLFLSFLFLISLVRNVFRIFEAKSRIDTAQSRVDRLQSQNEELKKVLAQAQSGEYVERQLRDKLGLSKEGEIIVVLPDEETLRRLAPKPIEEEETLPDPTWRKWLKLFL